MPTGALHRAYQLLDEIGDRMGERDRMNNITIYTKNKCQACMITKLHLANMEIPYIEKNVDTNEKFMDEAKATGYKSMPIVVKDGVVIASGFQPDQLNQLE